MRKPLRKLSALLAILATLPLAACATPTFGLSSEGALSAFRPIRASTSDTCETQRQIAEHNSAYDTIKNGKETVYKAACDQS